MPYSHKKSNFPGLLNRFFSTATRCDSKYLTGQHRPCCALLQATPWPALLLHFCFWPWLGLPGQTRQVTKKKVDGKRILFLRRHQHCRCQVWALKERKQWNEVGSKCYFVTSATLPAEALVAPLPRRCRHLHADQPAARALSPATSTGTTIRDTCKHYFEPQSQHCGGRRGVALG